MNSLSKFLPSPLLDFILSNLPSNNTEWLNELDMLSETLSEVIFIYSIEELPMTLAVTNQDQGITVASSSDILCYGTRYQKHMLQNNTTDHTSSMSTFNLILLQLQKLI